MTSQCTYKIELPSEYSFLNGWEADEGVWRCQQTTDAEYCAYHRKPSDTDNPALEEQFKQELTTRTDEPLELIGATFEYAEVDDVTVKRPVYLSESEFQELYLTETTFEERTDFHDGRFDECNFENSHFADAQFTGDAQIQDGCFIGATFENADFSDTTFQEADFSNATFNQVTFDSADFLRESHFESTEFGEGAVLTDAYLTRADFTDATLQLSNLEDADLSNALLFGTDLRGSRIAGTRFSGAQIDDETQILGNPENDGKEGEEYSISELFSKEHCVYDLNASFGKEVRDQLLNREAKPLSKTDLRDRARRVYRTLESLGQQSARPQLESKAFVRRKSAGLRQYRHDASNKGEYTRQERAFAAFEWARAEASRTIFLYGESPWRILGWSGIFVLVFGIIFAFGGHVETTGTGIIQTTPTKLLTAPIEFFVAIIDAIYYSMLVYTTLGFSTFHLVGLGKALGVIEASLGIIMASLLVFVLGRRAAR